MEESGKAYSEVVEILKMIEDEERIEKIPFEVIQLIKGKADAEYKPNISKYKPLEEQNLLPETYSIMAWIASKYWGENLDEENEEKTKDDGNVVNKETSYTQFEETIQSEEKPIRNAAVFNDIEPETLEGQYLPMLVSDMSLYERIKAKIIKLLKIIFRRSSSKEGASE